LDGRVYWPRNGDGKPRQKSFQRDGAGLAPFTIWSAAEVGDTSSAKKAVLRDFPEISAFDTPKPLGLLERIVHVGTDKGDLVLDFYLGSGTTAVAAQSLGRRWIGVEQNQDAVDLFVVPRIQSSFSSSSSRGFGVARLDR